MKYGQLTGKYEDCTNGHMFLNDESCWMCDDGFERATGLQLHKVPLTIHAYSTPNPNRIEVKFGVRNRFNCWYIVLATDPEQIENGWMVAIKLLDALNIIPEKDAYVWVEFWQKGKRCKKKRRKT